MKSQIVTSQKSNFFSGQEGGRRTLPYVFTEQGVYMLATVLRGELAEKQSIFIMRAFRELRHCVKQNQQFVTKSEWKLLTEAIDVNMNKINDRQDKADTQMAIMQESINKINDNFVL